MGDAKIVAAGAGRAQMQPGLGAAVYGAVLLALWTLAGRPKGAERDALAALRRLRYPSRT